MTRTPDTHASRPARSQSLYLHSADIIARQEMSVRSPTPGSTHLPAGTESARIRRRASRDTEATDTPPQNGVSPRTDTCRSRGHDRGRAGGNRAQYSAHLRPQKAPHIRGPRPSASARMLCAGSARISVMCANLRCTNERRHKDSSDCPNLSLSPLSSRNQSNNIIIILGR